MGLAVNLNLGQWAKEKTQRLVPFSTNKNDTTVEQSLLMGLIRRKHSKWMKHQVTQWNISPNPADNTQDHSHMPIYFADDFGYNHIDTLGNFKNWLRAAKQKVAEGQHRDGTYRTFLHFVENNARNSIKYGLGNCEELSSIAFLLLLECPKKYTNGETIRVEKINISSPGDHCFIVIGRDKHSNLRDPNTWGPNAVICDPWGGVNFAVQEQLRKPRDSRIPMFNYIFDNLTNKKLVFRALDGQIGQGHSQRWYQKGRQDLRSTSNYYSKQQNIPFFRTGGFQLSKSSAMKSEQEERVVSLHC